MREKVLSIKEFFDDFILDEDKRMKVQYIVVYALLSLVALLMSIVNIFTNETLALIATVSFAFLCILNLVLAFSNEICVKISRIVFEFEIFGLFIFFLITGKPDGFSALWVAMLPTSGMILFKAKKGSLLSLLMFLMLCFFFYTPFGKSLLLFEYNNTFMTRFPILFLAFYVVALFLEVVLEHTYSSYRHLYLHDPLTNALNRRGFTEEVQKKLKKNMNDYVGFLIFDLDHFKNINDKYGHFAGDHVLKETVRFVQEKCEFHVCRWGGEEFAIFFPDGNITQEYLDSLCNIFRDQTILFENDVLSITISIGAVKVKNNGNIKLNDICNAADEYLYEAKENGRDQAIFKIVDGLETKE